MNANFLILNFEFLFESLGCEDQLRLCPAIQNSKFKIQNFYIGDDCNA